MPSNEPGSGKPCAYCGKSPRTADFDPFCSRGCQDRDLVKWLQGGYVVPASDNEDELSDGASPEAPGD